MHAKYTTEGLILEKKDQGESNSHFSIFTSEFGKIEAGAQALREVKSKLRMNLPDLSFAEVSLVRGKQMWKITGAKEILNLYTVFKGDSQKLAVSANILVLLRRLLHGEEKNVPLFDLVFNAFLYCKKEHLSLEETKNFEVILVLNILHSLGYMGDKPEFQKFLNVVWGKDLFKEMGSIRGKALEEINRSLKESQL